MTDTGKEKCAHTLLYNEINLLSLTANCLKNLVYSMSVVYSKRMERMERMERMQEYEALTTLFNIVCNYTKEAQGSSEKIFERLESCALEVPKV